ncbi:MAG: helix-turn-helix transcriptional regulator [Rhodobacteraceae bacterium]|nr:helix-turn-helix transcriptional regulator [Paracoccaceae bacterium]
MVKKKKANDDLKGGADDGDKEGAFRRDFGKKLFDAMTLKGWNQSELARRTNIGRDSISQYINGKVTPNRTTAVKLADVLGVALSDLQPDTNHWLYAPSQTALEIKMMEGSPDRVILKVNQEVSLDVATKIMQLLRN